MVRKLIIYNLILTFAFMPLFANTPSSKNTLSQEDIEKIADRVVEKVQHLDDDPEYRQKMIEKHIAFQSSPEIQEFRREQMIKDFSNSKFQEARKQQMQKDLNESIVLKTYMNRGTILVVAGAGLFFAIGFIVGIK